jgi:hypothetical protein
MFWPFLVVSLADSGLGSLRDALTSATNGVTINFRVSGTITLTSGPLNVTTNVTLLGPDPGLLTVSGNNSSSVFNVTGTNVTLSGLTIANGYNSGGVVGAGITAAGVSGSRLTLYNCVVNANTNAGYNGGGILNSPGVTMVLSNCSVRGNSSTYNYGGGIYNLQGMLSIVGSTLNANVGSRGGAIYNDGGSGSATLSMANSTLSGNSADTLGGGVFNDGSSSPVTNKINSSTFSGNSASQGGAIDNYGPSGRVYLEIGDTILNVGAGSGGTIYNPSGTIKSDGYNLSSDAAGGDGTTGPGGLLNGINDIRNTNPMLGALQDNGGLTWTHALLVNSPAIDKGNADAITNLVMATDQRGLPRSVNLPSHPNVPGGDGSDIGAYELQVDIIALARPGFYTNGGGWALNGDIGNSGLNITNNVFTLTDGLVNEHRSAWFPYPLYVGGFQASFTYQDVGGKAIDGDGAAFVIQNDPSGTAALGVNGGGLGYVGISPSVGVLLNLYSGSPGGSSGLMLGTNGIGAIYTNGNRSGMSYQSTAPVNLNGGNPIAVGLRYTSGILHVSLADTVSSSQFRTNIPVDIPAFVGNNTAWVGFTGGDGGATSYQIVSNFTFRPLPALTIHQSPPGSLVFTWPASAYGFVLQSNPGLNNPAGWTSVAGTITQIGDLNQVTIPSQTGVQFYRLVLPGGP